MNKATIIDIVVPQEVTTTSINHIIKQHHISQRMRRKLKNDGHILINNNQANWDTLIHGNDHLVISIKPEQEFTHTKMNLDIVYEDDYILAINKSSGVLIHPTSTVRDGTLANGVLYYYNQTNQAHDFHPVHRLDKDTSGIVIIAKTSVVQHAFDKQRTKFQKVYDAIVEDTMPSQSLTINYPIGRKPGSIIERCCTLIGKPARTDVTVLTHHIVSQPIQMDINMSTRQVLTHVQCVLHTGRTHQIRVHLSHLGFPLAGDDLYGGHLDYIRRQALHAGYLAFTHPMTQEYIELRAPMPTDMKDLLYL